VAPDSDPIYAVYRPVAGGDDARAALGRRLPGSCARYVHDEDIRRNQLL